MTMKELDAVCMEPIRWKVGCRRSKENPQGWRSPTPDELSDWAKNNKPIYCFFIHQFGDGFPVIIGILFNEEDKQNG